MQIRHPLRWGLVALGLLIGVPLGAYFAARPGARAVVGVLSGIAIERSGIVASLPAMKPASVVHGPDEVEICGGGWIKPSGVSVDGIEGSLRQPATLAALAKAIEDSAAHADIVGRMRAGPSEFTRATAIVIEMAGLAQPGALTGPREVDPAPARDRLATLAASTGDPRVYALAVKACRSAAGEGACQGITPAQWSRLDPDNAAPWMMRLDLAAEAHDGAGVDEALHHIGASKHSALGDFSTGAEVLRAAPDDDASLLAVDRLLAGLQGVEAATGLPRYRHVIEACKGAALRDANRAETCAAVAQTLAERSDTLIDQTIGEVIGARVGWTGERVRRLRARRSAYQRDLGSAIDNSRRFDCRSVRSRLDVMRVTASLGEVEAMKAWAARAGRTDADFQREDEAFRASFAKAAASASSGAR